MSEGCLGHYTPLRRKQMNTTHNRHTQGLERVVLFPLLKAEGQGGVERPGFAYRGAQPCRLRAAAHQGCCVSPPQPQAAGHPLKGTTSHTPVCDTTCLHSGRLDVILQPSTVSLKHENRSRTPLTGRDVAPTKALTAGSPMTSRFPAGTPYLGAVSGSHLTKRDPV